MKGDTTEVTLEWHLSHMSEYRERNKKVEKSFTHTGARFLMGPSNKVRMPNNVSRHYVNGARRISRTGSNAIPVMLHPCSSSSSEITVHQFNLILLMGWNYEQGMKITRRRNDRKSMLTLINVVLGNCPYNDGWRLAGLYSDPDLVESDGQMRQPRLSLRLEEGRQAAEQAHEQEPAQEPSTRRKRTGEEQCFRRTNT